MENNNETQMPKQSEDKGALWAILLTIGMVIVMAILKNFIGGKQNEVYRIKCNLFTRDS